MTNNRSHHRIGKQCRERWFNHLDPAIKKGEWNEIEDNVVFEVRRRAKASSEGKERSDEFEAVLNHCYSR